MESITKKLLTQSVNYQLKEENKICPYCGKPYARKKFGSFVTPLLPVCECEEKQEQQRLEREKQELEQKRQEMEEKRKREQLQQRFENSMMKPFFRSKTFENLENNTTLEYLKNYAEKFIPQVSDGIQMLGNTGTGKTTSLAALTQKLMNNGYNCLFITFSALLDKFSKRSFNNAGDLSEDLSWLVQFDFIVLDDIGRETYTDRRKEIAFRIIDELMNYKVVTAFTANPEMIVKLKNIPEWTATLDRLKDMCNTKFEFKGGSYRGRN